MDNYVLVGLILGLVFATVWAWQIYLHHRANAQYSVNDVIDDANDAYKLIQKFAPAADQLVKIKELPEGKRPEYVVQAVQKVLPNLDPLVIRLLLEAWVVFDKPAVTKPADTAPAA